jgi:DNA modification methylase
MKPTWESDGVQLYLGDCLQIMPELAGADAVVTDPPYGIADVWKGGASHGWGVASLATPQRNAWDVAPPQKAFEVILRMGDPIVIWGGNYFRLPISRGWLVWNKPERGFTLAEAELAWTNLAMPMRVFDCNRSDVGRVHPTQKPLSLMKWCIEAARIPAGASVLDPFMGSGTTGVACVQTGRKFIGIEIDPGYFEVAKKRISEAQLQIRMPLDCGPELPGGKA